MAELTSSQRVLVLKKTKLSENDLILRCLNSRGELIEILAKGARKPTNPFASRLEIFSCSDVLLVSRRTLPIVKEARIVSSFQEIRNSLEKTTAMAPVTEILSLVAQGGLEHESLFPMTLAALHSAAETSEDNILTIASAHLIKALAMVGFMPNLTSCTICEDPLTASLNSSSRQYFSFTEGGLLCSHCQTTHEHTFVSSTTINALHYLLGSKFNHLQTNPLANEIALETLRFEQQWTVAHIERRLKSLDFLFSSNLWNNTFSKN